MPDREDVLTVSRFYVTIGDIKAAFRECSGLGSEHEIVEDKASGDTGHIYRKQPGRLKWDNITLKRGMTTDMKIWNWRKQIQDGLVDSARRSGSIVVYDQQNKPKAKWHFDGAWPSKLSGPALNAQNNEIAVEELVIVHEGCYREA